MLIVKYIKRTLQYYCVNLIFQIIQEALFHQVIEL